MAELDRQLRGWVIPTEDLAIATRADGSPWLLGSGGFGRVRSISCLQPVQDCQVYASGDYPIRRPLNAMRACTASSSLAAPVSLLQCWSVLLLSAIQPQRHCAQVYKGVLRGVQEVAVKQLRHAGGTDLEKFLDVRVGSTLSSALSTLPAPVLLDLHIDCPASHSSTYLSIRAEACCCG
jgi:hypothetical protein